MEKQEDFTRRRFVEVGGLGIVGLSLSSSAGASLSSGSTELASRLLMELELEAAQPKVVGSQRIIPVTGGTFHGPRLKGSALGEGGSWWISRPDGTNEINVRATLLTDDGHLIYLWSRGINRTPENGETYWRTTPVFETTSATYLWLNRLVAVGVGRGFPGKTLYRVYEIL